MDEEAVEKKNRKITKKNGLWAVGWLWAVCKLVKVRTLVEDAEDVIYF